MSKDELRDKQLAQLKEVARIFLGPIERLPFPVVVEAMTKCEIFPVGESAHDQSLLSTLAEACTQTVMESQHKAYHANRPNEVSVQVEKRLQFYLEHHKIDVEIPSAPGGRGGGGGYPDRLLWLDGEPSYLEVKVSLEENITQGSARNFFYQPTSKSKIQHNARHLLAGFALRAQKEKMWTLTGWKVVDLFGLRVKLKPEYNADNLEIYRDELILMEGNQDGITRRT